MLVSHYSMSAVRLNIVLYLYLYSFIFLINLHLINSTSVFLLSLLSILSALSAFQMLLNIQSVHH